MESSKINGVDFIDRIEELEKGYKRYIETSNFFSDYPKEIRYALNGISHDSFYGVKKMVKESERSLLIESYTISEQMLKNTKYQLLDFDETRDTDYQNFLRYKLDPTRFSPNPKIQEINKIFMRYRSRKLMLSGLSVYDKMIKERHRYAHTGSYNFNMAELPKIIGVLKYLEFEYRMFLGKTEWCRVIGMIINIRKGTHDNKKLLKELRGLSGAAEQLFEKSAAFITPDEGYASCNRNKVIEFLRSIKEADDLSVIERKFNNLRNEFRYEDS